ncbi:MAG: ThiF family adenylyltransferase, partial [Catenulispora sp.]|nr:ThiF family adenylyltransferase [Catenulispora sp.]
MPRPGHGLPPAPPPLHALRAHPAHRRAGGAVPVWPRSRGLRELAARRPGARSGLPHDLAVHGEVVGELPQSAAARAGAGGRPVTGRADTEPRAGAGSGLQDEAGFRADGETGLEDGAGSEPEAAFEPGPGLNDGDPFSRQRLLDGWRPELLAAATVVVAGVGALGNEVARILAMSGVGRLILTDPDTIETSNLSRAVLFRAGDVGRPKASTAAAALRELAPWTVVDARDRSLAAGVGLAELREATVVAGCLDSRAA